MSWDVSLTDPVSRKTIELDTPHFIRGGTYCINGTPELSLNITYNYGKIYREFIDPEDGLKWIGLLKTSFALSFYSRCFQLRSRMLPSQGTILPDFCFFSFFLQNFAASSGHFIIYQRRGRHTAHASLLSFFVSLYLNY